MIKFNPFYKEILLKNGFTTQKRPNGDEYYFQPNSTMGLDMDNTEAYIYVWSDGKVTVYGDILGQVGDKVMAVYTKMILLKVFKYVAEV